MPVERLVDVVNTAYSNTELVPLASSEPDVVTKLYPPFQNLHPYTDSSRYFDGILSAVCMRSLRSPDKKTYLLSVLAGNLPSAPLMKIQTTYTDEFITPLHTHSYTEIGIVVKGEYRIQTESRLEVFKEGEICIIGEQMPHNDVFKDKEACILFLMIGNRFFTDYARPLTFESMMKTKYRYIRFLPVDKDTLIPGLFAEILEEMKNLEAGSNHYIIGATERILTHLPSDYRMDLQKNDKASRNEMLFSDVMRYMEDNFRDISLEGLVAKFGHDIYYYSHLIKKHTGLTFQQSLRDIRLGKAAFFLRTSDASVERIIYQVGYESKAHFYKAFTGKYGVRPLLYRKAAL
jgi:AraC-like DNA-binding protein/quercetin dioxygenase-like cupin family protein